MLQLPFAIAFTQWVIFVMRLVITLKIAAFVPGYSGGTATDLNRLPYSSDQQQADRTPLLRSPDATSVRQEVNTALQVINKSDKRGIFEYAHHPPHCQSGKFATVSLPETFR